MIRKTILAVAATAVIGVASLAPASAHSFGHGHGFGFGGIGFGLGLVGASIAARPMRSTKTAGQYQTVLTPHGIYRQHPGQRLPVRRPQFELSQATGVSPGLATRAGVFLLSQPFAFPTASIKIAVPQTATVFRTANARHR